jgi:hypothetical protein
MLSESKHIIRVYGENDGYIIRDMLNALITSFNVKREDRPNILLYAKYNDLVISKATKPTIEKYQNFCMGFLAAKGIYNILLEWDYA